MTHHPSHGSSMSSSSAHQLAQGLGWFSIALGLAELVAPRSLARSLGMEGNEGLFQAYGAREIGTGIAILSSRQPAPWLWGRAAGDALDIATLACGMTSDNPKRGNVGLAIAAVAGVTALDIYCASAMSANGTSDMRQFDYSDRTGLPRSPEEMRGAASDFEVPRDMRAPDALRDYSEAAP